MRPSPILVIGAAFAVVIGLPFALYALLTSQQRRTTREIRKLAAASGWRYRPQRWQGNPTAFRIDGQSSRGLSWILTSGSTRGYDRGWSARLVLRFPSLGGETDLEMTPRAMAAGPDVRNVSESAQAKVSGLSHMASSAAQFLRVSQEFPTGVTAFDAAYRVMALRERFQQNPLERKAAELILHWPPESVQPHSVLAGRDARGFQMQARLPGPPNRSTVLHLLEIGDALCERVPAPVILPVSTKLADRLLGRILRWGE